MQTLSAERISSGAFELGLRLDQSQADSLHRYAALLVKWNVVHNLTAIDSPAEVLSHHLLDSLTIVPELQRVSGARLTKVLDVGSGGGLPGIPLAIAAPHLHVTLVDKVRKKVAFLTQVKLELALHNVECEHARVEAWQPAAPFELVVSRAFSSLLDLVRLTRHLLATGGWWCAMKGAWPRDELDALKDSAPDVRLAGHVRLRVPHLDAERHLILLQTANA